MQHNIIPRKISHVNLAPDMMGNENLKHIYTRITCMILEIIDLSDVGNFCREMCSMGFIYHGYFNPYLGYCLCVWFSW